MNFNKLASTINENITSTIVASEENEGRRGRAPNPEIEKLVNQGLPYWKARAMVRKGMASSEEPASTDTPKVSTVSKGDAKTQAAVDDFVSGNPEASVEEVIEHLKSLNAGPVAIKVGYNTDPDVVASMVAIAKDDSSEEPVEPSEPEIGGEDPDVDRLTNLFMKLYTMPKDQRADYMRKMKAAEKAKKEVESEIDADDGEDGDDVDPYVSQYVKGMKNEPEEEEEFDEPKED